VKYNSTTEILQMAELLEYLPISNES